MLNTRNIRSYVSGMMEQYGMYNDSVFLCIDCSGYATEYSGNVKRRWVKKMIRRHINNKNHIFVICKNRIVSQRVVCLMGHFKIKRKSLK